MFLWLYIIFWTGYGAIDKFMKEQDKRLLDLGVQISIYRNQKKKTQAQLAVDICISRTHMSNIEALNMSTQISVDTLFKIADVLGIKVSNLFEEI